MVVNSVDQVLDYLRETPLLRPDQFAQVEAQFIHDHPDPLDLLKHLVKLNWLTLYQAKKILNGRIGELVVGAYIIMDKLGEGGMGKVYKAWQTRLSRVVALKVIRQSLLTNETVLRRFQREAKAAAQLTHNNIVRLFDADQIGDKHYLAMEYVEGMDLAQLVKENGPLPIPSACSFIRQAALGLQHAHEKGLVHRDIKPSNLLVTADPRTTAGKTGAGGVLKILDMGLARVTESDSQTDDTALTQTGMVVGTPDYMSPEQGKNSSCVDPRSDLYALGCTLYFLLAGQPPFPKGSTLEKLLHHQIEPVPPINGVRNPELTPVPQGLEAIMLKLLAKRPDDRFQSGLDLANALEPWCVYDGNSPTQTYKAPVVPRAEEVSGSPFNFDETEPTTGPIATRRPERKTEKRPAIVKSQRSEDRSQQPEAKEPISEEFEPTPKGRTIWWVAGLGLVSLCALAVLLFILHNRKAKPESTSTGPETVEPKNDPSSIVKKDIEPLETVLNYLPKETMFVAVLNFAQLQQSPLFADEVLPHLDPDRNLNQIKAIIKFDPLTAIERVTVAVPVTNRDNPPLLFIVQGNGFLTPELVDFVKFHEKQETVGGTSVTYYESSPKPNEPVFYATKLSQSPATLALSNDKALVLNAYLRKIDPGPAPKKSHLDPFLVQIIQRNYKSAQAFFLAAGRTGQIPNAGLAKLMKGIHALSASFSISTELSFEMQIVGESYDEVLAFKQGMTLLFAFVGNVKKENRILAQFAGLLADAAEPKKVPDMKKPPVTIPYRVRWDRNKLKKWVRGFFDSTP